MKRSEYIRLIVILGGLTAFAPLATDMYLASFPMLAKDFGTSTGNVQSSLSAFLVGLSIGQLLYGPAVDIWGRKRPLQIGVLVFIVSSVAIAHASSLESLIGLRFVQAVGGCAGMVVSRAIVSDLFPESEAADALSIMMLVTAVAPIVAPVLGGFFVSAWGWQSVFYFLALFGLLCLLALSLGVSETLPTSQRVPSSFSEVMCSCGRLVILPDFIVPTLAGGLAFAGMFAFIAGSPALFMEVFQIDKESYGWVFASSTVVMLVLSQLGRLLLKGKSSVYMLKASLLAFVILVVILLALHAMLPVVVFLALISAALACIPLAGAAASSIAMNQAGSNKGSASALIGVLQFMLASISSVIVGLLYDKTAMPMLAVMLGCGLAALIAATCEKRNGVRP